MLEQIFLKVIDMSREAGIVIAVVLLVRIFLKRFPKQLSYLLWSVVLFRLLCPVTLESEISPVPNLKPIFHQDILLENTAVLQEPDKPVMSNPKSNEGLQSIEEDTKQGAVPSPASEKVSENTGILQAFRQKRVIIFGQYLWIAGVGLMLMYFLISAVKIRRKVSVSLPFKENIYIADEAVSPFVMGFLRPKIYLPEGLKEKEQEYIILHEKFHIRRLDYVVKPVAFMALAVHWFNPLVWLAFILFCRDMEMSCDEAVINRLGEAVRADYAASLLALSTKHHIISGIPVDFGEGDVKKRIKNLAVFRKTKKGVLAVLIVGVGALIICLAFTQRTVVWEEKDSWEEPEAERESKVFQELQVSLNIAEHYITRTGDPSNFYNIDESNVLWGSGRNEYGQLGQGTQDYEFYNEGIKIAENVIHVDYSQKGFAIFLTEDAKLYGMGNAGCGALQQYEAFDWTRYIDGEHYAVTAPVLLMEDVIYACCGRDDIVCLKEDGTVWTWGTVYAGGGFLSDNVYFIEKPKKILEKAVLVTGGWFHHAALLQDGTVWTWGYNGAGNCGVESPAVIKEPVLAAENVVMVWTNLTQEGPRKNTEYQKIAEFEGVYPRFLNNTLIQKADGSYWICGENVGSEEKVVHGAEGDYSVICTHEFYPCEGEGNIGP